MEQMVDPREEQVDNLYRFACNVFNTVKAETTPISLGRLASCQCDACKVRYIELVIDKLGEAKTKLMETQADSVIRGAYDSVLSRILLGDEDDEKVLDGIEQ